MPIIRKVIQHGNSRAVSLPKSWLVNAEEEAGRKIVALALEVNKVITVAPVFEKEQQKGVESSG
jgi:antitoxin component of MazEF toxin-antitoxin module